MKEDNSSKFAIDAHHRGIECIGDLSEEITCTGNVHIYDLAYFFFNVDGEIVLFGYIIQFY